MDTVIIGWHGYARMAITSALLLIGIIGQQARSATIVPGPAYLLSGTYVFSGSGAAGDTIQWYLDRRLTDEANGSVDVAIAIDSARGPEFTAALLHVSGKRTEYTVRAGDGGGGDAAVVRVFPPGIVSTVVYNGPNNAGKPVRVYVVAPTGLDTTSRVVAVMHGVDRNAADYIVPWIGFASQWNRVVIAPEFASALWPSSRSYNLGNTFTTSDTSGSPIPEPQWSFSILQEIVESIRSGFMLSDSLYDIWGHSAGAQFVHRMVLFKPLARIRMAIAANAGSYTFPDTTMVWPYGVQYTQLGIHAAELLTFTGRPLIVMRGTADTVRDSNLDTSIGADAEGPNRFIRAGNFVNAGRLVNPGTTWALYDVPGIGHDFVKMSLPAQELLGGIWPPPARPAIYVQTFGTTATLPPGWTTSGPSWAPSTSSASINYVGASGGVNLAASNSGGTAVSTLTLSGLTAIAGGKTIGARWGGRRSTSFTNAMTCEWSPDGVTWQQLMYAEVPNTTTWMHVNNGKDIRIAIPESGAPQPSFRWTFTQANNGGVYRLDDFEIVDLTVTELDDPLHSLPSEFALAQNFPNPFNPSTTIAFVVGAGARGMGDGVVKLVVYDLLGREVAVLVNEQKHPGMYAVSFDAGTLSSGVYLYRLTTGWFSQSRKMMVVK